MPERSRDRKKHRSGGIAEEERKIVGAAIFLVDTSKTSFMQLQQQLQITIYL
jgi:hypothetical protein